MSTASRIHIHKLIIHKVDHMSYDAPLLADLESPVDDPDVLSFLRQHILNNLLHRHARTARFVPLGGDGPSFPGLCDRLLDDPRQFVPQSQAIARHLFATMDRRVSPGDLILCTFGDRTDEAPVWLALLKLDPEDGFVSERIEVGGQVRAVLRRVQNVLPRGELQKCAFVLAAAAREARGFDLRVLDQQIDHGGSWRLVASFFSTRFLQCEVIYSPDDRTRAFYFGSHEWLKGRDDWPVQEVQRARRQVKHSLAGDRVDVARVAEASISSAEERDEYLHYLQSRGMRELIFQPDPDERDRLLRYSTFEGDHGLRVRIESQAVGAGQALSWEDDPDSGEVVVTIRTARWEEKA